MAHRTVSLDWIPEERPDYLIEQLTKFFRE